MWPPTCKSATQFAIHDHQIAMSTRLQFAMLLHISSTNFTWSCPPFLGKSITHLPCSFASLDPSSTLGMSSHLSFNFIYDVFTSPPRFHFTIANFINSWYHLALLGSEDIVPAWRSQCVYLMAPSYVFQPNNETKYFNWATEHRKFQTMK